MNEPIALNPFLYSKDELKKLETNLKKEFSQDIFNSINNWAINESEKITTEILLPHRNRRNSIESATEYDIKTNTGDSRNSKIKNFLIQGNPKQIADELKAIQSKNIFTNKYENIISKFEENNFINPIIQRYKLSQKSLVALETASKFSLNECTPSLLAHAEQFSKHIELLKNISSNSGLRTGAKIAASLVGGIFGGRIGARLVGGLLGEMLSPMAKIQKSQQQAEETLQIFGDNFETCIQETQFNIRYALASLYGGLLLRIEKDLNTLGQTITEINIEERKISTNLQPKIKILFSEWADATLSQLNILRKSKNWQDLASKSSIAVKTACLDTFRSQITPSKSKIAYSVYFARLRAISINNLADNLWNKGDFKDAAILYMRLINGSYIAWENDSSLSKNNLDEIIPTAGLRLAIYATTKNVLQSDVQLYLSAIPAFVTQAIFRSNASNKYIFNPGESISYKIIDLASSIIKFSQESGIFLSIHTNIPKDKINAELLNKTTTTITNSFHPSKIIKLIEKVELKTQQNNQFIKWLKQKHMLNIAFKATFISFFTSAAIISWYLYINKYNWQ